MTRPLIAGCVDPAFTFNNFIVGCGNEFCHATCRAVVANPGSDYRLLYIYGDHGLGKTHITHAVANALLEHGDFRIACYAAEQFIAQANDAHPSGSLSRELIQASHIDLLIVDDIEFLRGLEKPSVELQTLIHELYNNHKQVVLTSSCHPSQLPLVAPLRSLIVEQGLCADMQMPDRQARLAILAQYAEQNEITLDDDVTELLASRITTNIQDLSDAIKKLPLSTSASNTSIDLSIAYEALPELFQKDLQSNSCESIHKAVTAYFEDSQQR